MLHFFNCYALSSSMLVTLLLNVKNVNKVLNISIIVLIEIKFIIFVYFSV